MEISVFWKCRERLNREVSCVHRAATSDTPGQVRHPPVVLGDGLEPPDGLVLQGQLPEDLLPGVRLRHQAQVRTVAVFACTFVRGTMIGAIRRRIVDQGDGGSIPTAAV